MHIWSGGREVFFCYINRFFGEILTPILLFLIITKVCYYTAIKYMKYQYGCEEAKTKTEK